MWVLIRAARGGLCALGRPWSDGGTKAKERERENLIGAWCWDEFRGGRAWTTWDALETLDASNLHLSLILIWVSGCHDSTPARVHRVTMSGISVLAGGSGGMAL